MSLLAVISEAEQMDISNAQESIQGESSGPQQITIGMHQLGQPPEEQVKSSVLERLQPASGDVISNCGPLERKNRKTSAKSFKRRHVLRSSLGGSSRVLRSRSGEKPKLAEPSNNMVNVGSEGEKVRKKWKRRRKLLDDEFSRAKKHLRYLLHRISYEKNLIDVYSGEGWKGQSVEKIRPEKELQRAKAEILRRKLKIRDLFKHVDSLCAEGRLPESLFDAEGQIDCEDIFCAKCGSKEESTSNDIVLCDGNCERGFHQFCLDPPLLTVPAGDEGWLCPGCDCKVDCIDLLNESQGTNLSTNDNWEKVFPEAASAAAAGNSHNQSYGCPSDDSDDNDYDPNGPEVGGDEGVQGDKSSSSQSDFTSASDDLEVSHNNEQYLGLPSDDSEDDDFDPSASEIDEHNKPESSSSDFTSDSEDLTAAIKDAEKVKDPSLDYSKLSSGSVSQRSKMVGKTNLTNDELLPTLESNPRQDDSGPVSGKRNVERKDYKRLYDEAYGNSSDSSDDEDWIDADVPKEGDTNSRKVSLSSPNGNSPTMKNAVSTKDLKHKDSEHCSSRKTSQKLNIQAADNSAHMPNEGSSEPGFGGRTARRRECKRLGETINQGLYEHFNNDRYPDRAAKENMAQELGLTVQQVSKWFENTRWKVRNSSSTGKDAQNKGTPKHIPMTTKSLPDAALTGCQNIGEESSKPTSSTPNSRRRKGKSGCQVPDQILGVDERKTLADLPNAQERHSCRTSDKNR